MAEESPPPHHHHHPPPMFVFMFTHPTPFSDISRTFIGHFSDISRTFLHSSHGRGERLEARSKAALHGCVRSRDAGACEAEDAGKKKKPHTHAFPTPLALVSHVADHISPIDYLYFSIT